MKNEIIRFLLRIHKKLPFVPFEKEMIKLYHKVRKKSGFVESKINGINYVLDLGEVIDNGIFYDNWEPKTTHLFKKFIKPKMTFIDIGANIGYFTLIAGKEMKNQGKIISFEPTKECFDRLKLNVSKNKFKNIVLERLALSDKNEGKNIAIRSSWKIERNNLPEKQEIEMIKLDDYLKKRKIGKIDFMKIDVDGFEWVVLKGAKNTLKNNDLILCLEIGYGQLNNTGYDFYELIEFLQKMEYSFFSEDGIRIDSPKKIIDSLSSLEDKSFGAGNFFLRKSKKLFD